MNDNENIISASLRRNIEKYKPDIREALLAECSIENKQPIVRKAKIKYTLKPVFAAVAICLMFFITVNTAPVVALNLAKIPIIDKLVWASVIDKGIFKALDEGFAQQINEAVSENDIMFTIHHMIYGNKINFLLSLTFPYDTGNKKIESVSISATDQNKNELSFTSAPLLYDEGSEAYIFDCNILPLSDSMISDITSINLKITGIAFDDGTQIKGTWQTTVSTPLDNPTQDVTWEKEINTTITMSDGISFMLKKIVSTPSDTAVYITINSEDARSAPRGMYVVDNKGNKTAMINSIGNKLDDSTQFRYYFNSVYPNVPSKIFYNDGDSVKELDLD